MKQYLLGVLIFLLANANAQQKMHRTEQLLNGTIRIERIIKIAPVLGQLSFLIFYADKGGKIPIPVIITNKNVVNGFNQVHCFLGKQKTMNLIMEHLARQSI